ncbi:MAG: family 78 glycoside hydrolase catalytic domain [Clostridia bacterium]|nr:family 78 glycoside hydrolase catalytic domain [Clostridia bacterium]
MLNNSKWISYPEMQLTTCPVFKKDFNLKGEIKKAILQLSSLGCYYATINDKRVGDFILAPGFTSNKRSQVQAYDITSMLSSNNELRVTLSQGWFKGRMNWRATQDMADIYPSIIGELKITYQNGESEAIVTDEGWSVSLSKITFADIYDGEHYDANFKESFVPVKVNDYSKARLCKQQGEIIKEQEIINPHKIFKTPKGETVIDFNQNLTGYFEICLNATKGERVSFSVAEVLDKDGNFYNENYRSAKSEFIYTCCDGYQTYKPKLTFYGFRYIRVNEFPFEITEDNIRAIVIHSEMKRTGYLDSSSELLNKLFSNIIWGQKGNFVDVPTDCPQRDERMGWTGDAQVFVKTASYNFDCEKFFEKWLTDLRIDQTKSGYVPSVVPQLWGDDWSGCGWGDASIICPWQIYLTYGNKEILRKQYNSMCLYLKYIASSTKKKYLWIDCEHFGDWLGLDSPAGSYKGASRDNLVASAFYYYSTGLVIKAGKALNKNVEKYERLRENILKSFRKEFTSYETQTECVLALHFGLCENKKAVAKQLSDMIVANGKRLKTGFLGTPYLLHALSDNGYTELAYDLLLQENYPSWLYSVKQGATTIWEHWDGINDKGEFWSKDMNSFNHYAYGSVADWVYGVACGIQTVEDKPGFEEIVIAPKPTKKLNHLSASIETRHGLVSSKWIKEGNSFRYEIITPSKSTIIIDNKEYKVDKGAYVF